LLPMRGVCICLFLQLQLGSFTWWQPIDLMVEEPVSISAIGQDQRNQVAYQITNHSLEAVNAQLMVNGNQLL